MLTASQFGGGANGRLRYIIKLPMQHCLGNGHGWAGAAVSQVQLQAVPSGLAEKAAFMGGEWMSALHGYSLIVDWNTVILH